MVDEKLIQARVIGRTAANDLADLYVSESARLNGEHGFECSLAFLETLRDHLISIRPLPKEPEPEKPAVRASREHTQDSKTWGSRRLSRGYVLVDFDGEVDNETDKGIQIDGDWCPKSQIQECEELEVGDYVAEWSVTQWFADTAGLDY